MLKLTKKNVYYNFPAIKSLDVEEEDDGNDNITIMIIRMSALA